MSSDSSNSSQGSSSSYGGAVGNSDSLSAGCMLISTGWYLPNFSSESSQSGQSSSGLSVLMSFSPSFSWLEPFKGRVIVLCSTGQNQTSDKVTGGHFKEKVRVFIAEPQRSGHYESNLLYSSALPVFDVEGSWAAISLRTEWRVFSSSRTCSPPSKRLGRRLTAFEGCRLWGKDTPAI